jgi:pimeloyl-ACP methyl ester carboxylesterase
MTVITLDLAGHGSSGRAREAWTIRNFATDVAAVVRAVGGRRIILVGHSLGGPVALEAALLLRQETVAVVGVDTFFDGWLTSWVRDVSSQLRADFGRTVSRLVRGFFSPTADSALVSRVVISLASAPPEIAIPAFEDLHPWMRDRFAAAVAALEVPLAVLQASSAGHAALQGQRSRLRGLEVDSMPGSGHFMMLENPGVFNTHLDSLLQRVQRTNIN